MEDRNTTMTDTEVEQPIEKDAHTKNCDRGLDWPFDSEVQSAGRTDSQTVPNLQTLDSESGLVKYILRLDAENILKDDKGSDAVTDPCDGRNNQSGPSNLCIRSAEGGTRHSSSTPQSDATMPASLDCIRVLSSDNTMERERAASARSTRKVKKTGKQAKRFGFWVLSKIFV